MNAGQLGTARAMWRALLDGEAGHKNCSEARIRLQSLFRDLLDGATLNGARMVEELIMEFDPDYKKHMGIEVRPGYELDFVLPESMYDILGSPDRPDGR